MTTIAFDGKYLAADKLCICGDRIEREPWIKIRKVENPIRYTLMTGTGNGAVLEAFFDWMNQGRAQPFPDLCRSGEDRHSSDLIAVTVDGEMHNFTEAGGVDYKTKTFDSQGSGRNYAMGAMLAGVSAIEAVRIASEVDIYSGGGVLAYDVKTGDVVEDTTIKSPFLKG